MPHPAFLHPPGELSVPALMALVRRIPESFRILLMALLVFLALMSAKAWPDLKVATWAFFLVLMGLLCWAEVSGTVNYESIRIDGGTLEYVAFGLTHLIRLEEVSKLELVRVEALFEDLDGPYVESKWILHSGEGSRVEVMDEWPHRQQLLRAFRAHLPNFDEAAARAGLTARGEGRWLCHSTRGGGDSEG